MEQELDQLAFDFFKLFARYESTLKLRGYSQAKRNNVILVDWDRFANEIIGKRFRQKLRSAGFAADYILDYPPNKLVVNEENKIV